MCAVEDDGGGGVDCASVIIVGVVACTVVDATGVVGEETTVAVVPPLPRIAHTCTSLDHPWQAKLTQSVC